LSISAPYGGFSGGAALIPFKKEDLPTVLLTASFLTLLFIDNSIFNRLIHTIFAESKGREPLYTPAGLPAVSKTVVLQPPF
jgi:hypothetical protein